MFRGVFSLSCAAALTAFLLSTAAQAQTPPDCALPANGSDGWQIAPQQENAANPAGLCDVIGWLDGFPASNIHSVLVARHGKLIFEHYRKGSDDRRGKALGEVAFGPDVQHDVRSVSKSVTSLLVGIAIEQGLIASIDEPVYRHFPEFDGLRSPERDLITIRHLLTMSSGLDWDENLPYSDPNNSEIRMVFAPDPYRFAWEQKPVAPAGEWYNYNGGSTELLAQILQKVGGARLEDFSRMALFEPLGISQFEWQQNPNGQAAAASGLRLRPRDMAKIGQLILAGGRWGDRQVVPEAWIRDSTAPQIAGSQLYFYGFQWWLGRSLVRQKEIPWTAAVGNGGQRIFIVPSLDAVVVITGGLYRSNSQSWITLAILNRVLKGLG